MHWCGNKDHTCYNFFCLNRAFSSLIFISSSSYNWDMRCETFVDFFVLSSVCVCQKFCIIDCILYPLDQSYHFEIWGHWDIRLFKVDYSQLQTKFSLLIFVFITRFFTFNIFSINVGSAHNFDVQDKSWIPIISAFLGPNLKISEPIKKTFDSSSVILPWNRYRLLP